MSFPATPSSPSAMSDSLQSILAHAEALNMLEGDYLSVCNALKQAFTKNQSASPAILRPHQLTSSPTELAIYFDDCLNDCSVKSFVKSAYTYASGTITMDTTVEYNDKTARVQTKNFVHDTVAAGFCNQGKLVELFAILKPKTVRIIIDDMEFVYTLEKAGKRALATDRIVYESDRSDDDEDFIMFDYNTFSMELLQNFKTLVEAWFTKKASVTRA